MGIASLHSVNRKSPLCTLNLSAAGARTVSEECSAECPTRRRLSTAFERLKNIELVRNHRQDRSFGKPEEDRIVWRELIELEMQEACRDRAE